MQRISPALAALLALACLLPCGRAVAQAYPNKPVRILVPFVAGGTSDIVARAVGQKLTEAGYTTLVENRPGANGSIAAEALAKSPADGYTIMVGSIGTFAINMGLYKNPKYDTLKDFDAITVAVRTPNVLITPPGFPAANLKEFIDYARRNPGKVSYGSSGSGSSDHLSAELFKQQTRTFGVHIPYRGGAAAQTDIMAGNIEASFQNFGTVVPYIRAGKMKALAVTSAARMPQLPNVPTMIESGIAGFDVTSWQAVAAPRGTPKDIINKLHADIARGFRAPDLSQRFADQGFENVLGTPEQTAVFFKAEIERWARVVAASGAQVD
jgi:tripartite-type tricarboxylate transporter receptor subunit TctC